MSFWREGGAYQGWNIGGLEQPSHKKWLFVSPMCNARGIRWDPHHNQSGWVGSSLIIHYRVSFTTLAPSMLPDTTRDDAELTSNSAGIRRIHFTVRASLKPTQSFGWRLNASISNRKHSCRNGLGTQGLSQRWVIMKDDIWDYNQQASPRLQKWIWNYKSNILHDGIHQGPDLHSAVTQCWRDPARDCELSQHT